MSARSGASDSSFTIVCFGDGTIPEVLRDCMQYRLVCDRVATGSAGEGHVLQLRRHIEQRRCRACRSYLMGRMAERRLRDRRITAH